MGKINPWLDSALKLIEEKGWNQFDLPDLTDEKTTLDEVHKHFPSKFDVLKTFGKYIDESTIGQIETFDASESERDRLFSIMMTRFDVLTPHKALLKILWRDVWQDPCTVVNSLQIGAGSMDMILRKAGLETSGLLGLLRVKTFGVFYLATVWTWMGDENPDMDETMAALDQNLSRLGQFPQFFTAH